MTDHDTGNSLDVLIDHVLEHGADAASWDAYAARVNSGTASWEELAEALVVEHNLRVAARPVLAAHQRVTLPSPTPAATPRPTARPWLALGGWAAALLVAVAWVTLGTKNPDELAPGPAPAHAETAAAAFQHYLTVGAETGEVVRALPPRLVQVSSGSRAAPEVLVLRRSLERAAIRGHYQVVEDELGARHLTPVEHLPDRERHL